MQRYVPTCEYHLINLRAYPDEALRGTVVLQVVLLTLKYIFQDEEQQLIPFLDRFYDS
jgi:hypothetical protein